MQRLQERLKICINTKSERMLETGTGEPEHTIGKFRHLDPLDGGRSSIVPSLFLQ